MGRVVVSNIPKQRDYLSALPKDKKELDIIYKKKHYIFFNKITIYIKELYGL